MKLTNIRATDPSEACFTFGNFRTGEYDDEVIRAIGLSGGQRQRVALARAIVRSPIVFLMDKPLSNLDARLRLSMRNLIKELHLKLQTTIIYVTHDQLEAMTLADRIVVMNEGKIEQIGTPKEIYEDPIQCL